LFEFLGSIGKDVRGFGHEVHSAKDDRSAIWTLGSEFAQLVGVTGKICMLDDLVLLVVMAKDKQTLAKGLFGLADPLAKLIVTNFAVGGKRFRRIEG
jgi:hypothetical protein